MNKYQKIAQRKFGKDGDAVISEMTIILHYNPEIEEKTAFNTAMKRIEREAKSFADIELSEKTNGYYDEITIINKRYRDLSYYKSKTNSELLHHIIDLMSQGISKTSEIASILKIDKRKVTNSKNYLRNILR